VKTEVIRQNMEVEVEGVRIGDTWEIRQECADIPLCYVGWESDGLGGLESSRILSPVTPDQEWGEVPLGRESRECLQLEKTESIPMVLEKPGEIYRPNER
jgi:hypothetical protein